MRKITLIAICSMLTALCFGQPCPDPPAYDNTQYFCSAGAWALIGEDADNLGDLQIFAEDLDWTITWYADAALTTPITDPDNELLVGGTTYYVTQTDDLGCESDPLEINVEEKDCACIKDPTFEKQNGVPSARGYEFFQFIGISNHKTCGQTMEGANLLPMGTIDGYTGTDDAVLVTPGPDPTHIDTAGDPTVTLPLVRTNPDNPVSSHGLRINRGAEYGGPGGNTTITAMQKEFIAGEVFVFNFALVVQNPPGHSFDQMPFGQVRLYDENDNLIQQRCLVSDTNDCIFSSVVSGSNTVLYSEWSCMKFYTLEHQGEPVRAEFVTAYCTPTQHYAFMYIDDMYVGDDRDDLCTSAAFGHAVISDVGPAGESCFISEPATAFEGCTPGLSGKIPGFPLQVCGTYSSPISQGGLSLEDFTLRIIQNNAVVGTVSNPQPGDTPNSYCFEVTETDLLVSLPYGNFNFEVDLEFELDCGQPYSYNVDSNVNFDLCPTAGCPNAILICDSTGTGITTFDLTEAQDEIYGDWTTNELTLTYYEDLDDAHDGTNEISDIENFENTQSGGQTIYVRLDWDMDELDDSCYYLVELELVVAPLPELEWEDEIVVCDEAFTVTLFARPDNLEDMGQVSYTWFRNDVQIPHAGSFYDVTTPGIYTVIVSGDECETTQTVEVKQVSFEVELGDDVESCDEGGYTITAQVTPTPGSEPVDPSELTYLWSTGETTQSITVTDTDLYWVDVSYEDCMSSDDIFVAVAQSPIVSLGPDIEMCKDDSIILEAVVENLDANDLTFNWYDGGDVAVGTGPTFEVTNIFGEETYTVEVYEPGAEFCYGEDSITVKLYDNENCVITQGISPGGSLGQNDALDLRFLSERTGIHMLQIFNRHGLLVYEQRDYVDQWQGQGSGDEDLPTGTYFYVLHFSGDDPVYGTQTNGWIYINRDMN